MLLILALLSMATNGAAEYCMLNQNNTGCVNSTATGCVNVCSQFFTRDGCNTTQACTWDYGYCFDGNDNCGQYDAATCTSDPKCVLQTTSCKLEYACSSSFTSATTAAECTAQGYDWLPRCFATTPCGMADTAAECIGTPGCFWLEALTASGSAVSECQPCFDPSAIDNLYLSAQAHLNQTCYTLTGSIPGILLQNATASSQGCQGGALTAPLPDAICGPVGEFAGTCAPKQNASACQSDFFATCENNCSFLESEQACVLGSDCSWNGLICDSNGGSTCSVVLSSTLCAALGCTWKTWACEGYPLCRDIGMDNSCWRLNESECNAASSLCTFDYSCSPSVIKPCNGISSQSACTANPGCFWSSEFSANTNQVGSFDTSRCLPCAGDPFNIQNYYLGGLSLLNQSCVSTSLFENTTRVFLRALPSASGCSSSTGFPATNAQFQSFENWICHAGIDIPQPLATCQLNATSDGCESSSISQCVNACELYESSAGCLARSGCTWKNVTDQFGLTGEGCRIAGSGVDDCLSRGNDTCTGVCYWQTQQCAMGGRCAATMGEGSCFPTSNADACAAQSGCMWLLDCQKTDGCAASQTASQCTGTAGCFWQVTENAFGNKTQSVCRPCFNDPSHSENKFTLYQSHTGDFCFIDLSLLTILNVTAAPTGCDGGITPALPAGAACTPSGAGYAMCDTNDALTGCKVSNVSLCLSACDTYQSQTGCSAFPGCKWVAATGKNDSYCTVSGMDDKCGSRATEACNGTCFLSNVPCEFSGICSGASCNQTSTAAACTAQPGCEWFPQCGIKSGSCDFDNATQCVATPGCFWTAASVRGKVDGFCGSCFYDPLKKENLFLALKAYEGKNCTEVGRNESSLLVSVSAASTGCSGGSAFPYPGIVCQNIVSGASALSVVAVSLFSLGSFVAF